jgi:hypothetical protein
MHTSSLTRTSTGRALFSCAAALALFAFGGAYGLHAADLDGAAPFFNQYCTACHSESVQSGGVSLTELMGHQSVAEGFHDWEKVIAAIAEKRMPPKMMPQPSDEERYGAVSWVRDALHEYAKVNDGAPGRVTVRRLTSGEYSYTIQDITGIHLSFERDFVADSVGGEGFTNFGDAQFTADAELELYLDAAKRVADHAVIGAGPLIFDEHPGMTGFELSAIHRIHDIYSRYGFRAASAEGGRPFGLERYGQAFLAAWRYHHRAALGQPNKSLEEFGAEVDLNPKFIQHIWGVLEATDHKYPTTEVLGMWRGLPAPDGNNEDAVMAKCEEIQKFVINWPRWLLGAGELAMGGAGDERALVITDEALQVSTKEEMTFLQRFDRRTMGAGATVHISVEQANPGAATSASVIFRDASVRLTRDDEPTPLRELLDAETVERLALGRGPNGTVLGPDDFVVGADQRLAFTFPVPEDSRGVAMRLTAEITGDPGDSVLRVLMSESEDGQSGRPAWALFGDSNSDGFKAWKEEVLEYAGYFPQTSHGEPTPSDRDPIPLPSTRNITSPSATCFTFA